MCTCWVLVDIRMIELTGLKWLQYPPCTGSDLELDPVVGAEFHMS